MREEIKHIIVGTVKSFAYAGGLKVSESLLSLLTNVDNWYYVDSKNQIISNSTVWCFEYRAPEDTEDYFLQVELYTEWKTVTAINVIAREENRISAYSK
jgi:hypothetical protein